MSHTNIFYKLLGNTMASSVTNMTVWFALSYFAYLETQSVLTTGIVAGIYLVVTAGSGFWLGSLVDHYKKKNVMQAANFISLTLYAIATVIYVLAPQDAFKDPASVTLWVFIVTLLLGVIAGNIRTITLPTLVTILIPADKRDKANGLSGAISGASFLVVSVISGLLMGFGGMISVLLVALGMMIVTILHLMTISIPEKGVVHLNEEGDNSKKVDLKGTIAAISAVPGLFPLIFFATFNNFLGGVYMALLDAYGLSLVSVQTWGILWGVISSAFIVGGLIVSKKGLGKSPLRTMFLANLAIWTVSSLFTIQSWIWLLTAGMFIYLLIVPIIEAAEQTILQKVVPPNRQGRVFGFAQSIEQAASPLTAFLIGPLAQFVFIPFMTNGAGADAIGSWFGTGADRGIALLFTITGVIGFAGTLAAMGTKYYRQLSEQYRKKSNDADPTPPAPITPQPTGEHAGVIK